MSHEVETMLYVGETPWHGLGVKLDNPPTVEEAIKRAGCAGWNVRKVPLFLASGAPAPDCYATVRDNPSTGAIETFGPVGPAYAVMPNEKVFSFFEPTVRAGEATIETAGSLRGGRIVWCLARLAGAPIMVAEGDDVARFLLLSTSHDGSQSTRVMFAPIRVVCANTLAVAHAGAGAASSRKVRHTRGAGASLRAAALDMDLVRGTFDATASKYRALAARSVRAGMGAPYIRAALDLPALPAPAPAPANAGTNIVRMARALAEEAEKASRAEERAQATIANVAKLYTGGRGNGRGAPVRGTWWNLYNAVTEHLTHHARGDAEARAFSGAFGANASAHDRALSLALEMSA